MLLKFLQKKPSLIDWSARLRKMEDEVLKLNAENRSLRRNNARLLHKLRDSSSLSLPGGSSK